MEIRDYLKIVKRRLWIFVVLPLLAAIVAFFVFSGKPQQFQSKVETSVPSLAQNTTVGAVTVYVANFKEFLTTQPVIDRVSKETGVAAGELRSGLSATEVGTSNLIEVTYTSTSKASVQKVAVSATNATLDLASGPNVSNAKAAVQVAQDRFDKARAATQGLVSTLGGLPEDQYQEMLHSLAVLKLEASTARLDLDIPKADGLDAQIPHLEQEIADLLPNVLHYQQLSSAQAEAATALSNAFVREQDTEAQVVAHADPVALKSSTPTKVNSTLKLGTSIGIVVGIALILAGLIIVFLEIFDSGRARRSRETTEVTAAAPIDSESNGSTHPTAPVTEPAPAAEPVTAQS